MTLSSLLFVPSDDIPKYAVQTENYITWKHRASDQCSLLIFPKDSIYTFFFQRNCLFASSDKHQGIGTAMQKWIRRKLNKVKQRLCEMKSMSQPCCDTGLKCVFKSFSSRNSEQRAAAVWHVISSLQSANSISKAQMPSSVTPVSK